MNKGSQMHITFQQKLSMLGLALAVAVLGCDNLVASPGDDFRVRILSSPAPEPLFQTIEPVEVRFAVDGCDEFSVELKHQGEGVDPVAHPVTFERLGSGEFVARLPLEWFTNATACGWWYRYESILEARCHQDHRTAVSETFKTGYEAANSATWSGEPMRTRSSTTHLWPALLQPADSDFVPDWPGLYVDAVWSFDGMYLRPAQPSMRASVATIPTRLHAPAAPEDEIGIDPSSYPDSGPLFVLDSQRAYFFAGCPLGPCQSGYLYVYERSQTGYAWGSEVDIDRVIRTPVASAIDMTFEAGGKLVLSSQEGVFRLDALEGDTPVWHETRYENERIASPFRRLSGGDAAFLTLATDLPDVAYLRRLSGAPRVAIVLPGIPDDRQRLVLAPDAKRWLLVRFNEVWLGGEDQDWVQLNATPEKGWLSDARAAWLDDGVAIWTGHYPFRRSPGGSATVGVDKQRIEVFGFEPRGELRYRYELAHDLEQPQHNWFGIAAAGRRLLVARGDGLRILDAQGREVGGAVLPGCFVTTPPVVLGDDLAALAAGDLILFFDLRPY